MEQEATMRLLVTESDPMVRQWLGVQAAELGITLVFASDGDETRRAITDEEPDCVVLDASTSAEDDAPLWSQLRRAPETQHIPLLLYSSSQRWQRVAELAANEVDGILTRPFTTATLLDAARRASAVRQPSA